MSNDIWIVDDDRGVRFVLAAALRDAGLAVREFDAAGAVRAALRRSRPALLLTDVRMPGESGLALLEELKAQTGSLYFIDFAKKKGLVSDDLAKQAYLHDIIWSFGHISRGMYDENKKPKPYSQLSAIQLGFLIEEGAVKFDENATAANGTDKGALVVDMAKVPAAVEKLMKKVATIKATGDKAGAEALIARYVDSDTYVPRKAIVERMLRFPKASFVYSVEM